MKAKMSSLKLSGALVCLFLAVAQPAHAQLTPEEAKAKALGYRFPIHGPRQMELPGGATIEVPKGYQYLDAADTKFMLDTKGIPSDGRVMLAAEEGIWNMYVKYTDDGRVRDSDAIVPDYILPYLAASYDSDGGRTVGWAISPHYDVKTRRLEWSVFRDFGADPETNLVVVILARRGYFSLEIVSDTTLEQRLATLTPILSSFKIAPGYRYEDFLPGDKVAPYGILAIMGVPSNHQPAGQRR